MAEGEDGSAEFELKLLFFEELKLGYQQARDALERFLTQPDPEAVAALGAFFHRIAGTAHSVRLPLLGYLAAMSERLCQQVKAGSFDNRSQAAQLFADSLAGVAAVLDEHGFGSTERPLSARQTTIEGLAVPDALGEGRELSKVLVVDDDPYSAGLIDSCLRNAGFISSYCCNPREALKVIEAELPDLIIMDVVMPELDGFELCRRVREHPALQFTPIIFVTRRGDLEERVRGLEVGGNDYVPKPFEPRELVARVRSHLTRLAALREMAVRDGLTRCYNHKYFRLRLEQEIGRAQRYEHRLAVAMLDADRFKEVNDNYGHRTGDRVLAHLASLVVASVRATDVVARYGGEEFAILMAHAGLEEAMLVCNRLQERIWGHQFSLDQEEDERVEEETVIPLTVSIGVTELAGEEDSPERIISRADAALYEAKAAGRNCVRFSEAEEEPG